MTEPEHIAPGVVGRMPDAERSFWEPEPEPAPRAVGVCMLALACWAWAALIVGALWLAVLR